MSIKFTSYIESRWLLKNDPGDLRRWSSPYLVGEEFPSRQRLSPVTVILSGLVQSGLLRWYHGNVVLYLF